MKTILFLSLLLLLASCGGGKSSNNSTGTQNTEPQQSQETKDEQQQINCLENTLGWTRQPPEDKSQVLKQLSRAKFEKCASAKIMDLYIERVMLAHPQLTF